MRTPVWLSDVDSKYYLFTQGKAGKVKRIRANAKVRLAACDVRGNVFSGWLDARARIVSEPDLIQRVYEALRQKYRWQMAIADFFAKLTGRYHKRVIIELKIVKPQ